MCGFEHWEWFQDFAITSSGLGKKKKLLPLLCVHSIWIQSSLKKKKNPQNAKVEISITRTLCCCYDDVTLVICNGQQKAVSGCLREALLTWLWRWGKVSVSPGEEGQRSHRREQASLFADKCTFLSSPVLWAGSPTQSNRSESFTCAEVHIKDRKMLGLEPGARDALRWDKGKASGRSPGAAAWTLEGWVSLLCQVGKEATQEGKYLISRRDFKTFVFMPIYWSLFHHGWTDHWKYLGR